MNGEEKMREEFEEYASQHYWMREHDFDYSRDVAGEYASDEMQLSWEFWKASRESLVIELPGRNPEYIGDRDHQQWACGCNYGINSCRESIHAAGVKTK